MSIKISLTSGVYLNYLAPETLERVAASGYDGIDYWCGRPHIYRRDYSLAELAELRRQGERLGLEVPSLLPAFFRYPHSLTSPREVVWQDSLDYMKHCVDNADCLGARVVLVVPTHSLAGQPPQDAWERLRRGVDEICRYAAPRGIWMGVEVVNTGVSDLVNTAADAACLLEQLDHENLGVVLDTGHMNLSSEPAAEAVRRLGSRLLQVHVNDNDGRQQQNLIPGDGCFDFQGLIRLLRSAGYSGYLSAELGHAYTADPDSAARTTAARLRAWLEASA